MSMATRRTLYNWPARLVIKVPEGVSPVGCVLRAADLCDGRAHVLRQREAYEQGEVVLVQAGGSGIGSAAIRLAKDIGAIVYTTVGDDEKAAKAKALGADEVINYRKDRFEGVVRKLTKKKGVDVVFEHTGAETWNGSLLSMKKGGRLVTCGSTSGPTVQMNLMQLFQQQYKIFGSFGFTIKQRSKDALDKIAGGSRSP
jgi:alcohol dehydrogenase